MIEKLDNNEQVLLMYLADELDAEDQLEFEQMLAVDANLRNELRLLEESQRLLHEGLERLDEASPLGAVEAAAVRRASREIRRRLARPAAVSYAPPPLEHRRRSLWWAYPAAAAAVVILAAALWMPRHHAPVPQRIVQNTDPFPQDVGPYYSRVFGPIRLFQDSWDQPGDFDEIAAPADEPVAVSDAHDPHKDAIPVDQINQLLLSADASD